MHGSTRGPGWRDRGERRVLRSGRFARQDAWRRDVQVEVREALQSADPVLRTVFVRCHLHHRRCDEAREFDGSSEDPRGDAEDELRGRAGQRDFRIKHTRSTYATDR